MVGQAKNKNLPVIVIGGWSTRRASYELVMMDLGVDREIHFLNPGRSIGPGTLLQRKVAEVRRYVEENQIEKVDFVGHSLGAVVATTLAAETPVMVREVVLVNPVGVIGNDSYWRLVRRSLRSFASDLRRAVAIGEVKQFLRAVMASAVTILRNPILTLIREPALTASTDITSVLRGLKRMGVKVCLLKSASDWTFPNKRVEETLSAAPFDLLDRWVMYAEKSATHNAPLIEVGGALRQILDCAS